MAPQSDYRVKVRFPNLDYPAIQSLKLLEVSTLGIHQLTIGQPVSEARDRDLLGKLLTLASQRPGSLIPPRVGWELQLRFGSPEDLRRIAALVELATKSLPAGLKKTG
jgi:hypothetical protein